ncbi:hypothetical protein [Maritalea myrionectae]|uniref:hypothetical protein n=1 Tax=Maritalea myrionectae TaxID=454601 RepID=UPI000421B6F2|nr:hypothetical protein [Maritalea myrionectae]
MEDDTNQAVSLPYHQPAFMRLMTLFNEEINFALTQKCATFRGELFLSQFKPSVPIEDQTAWDFARNALDILDAKMGKILSRRSAAYWLHIYRRIGVSLSPNHEEKTDPVTVGLVRQIVELAIQKHGRLESIREFGNSTQLGPNLILGGWMKKGLKTIGRNNGGGERFYRSYCKLLRREPIIVLREFGKKDFLSIYEVEGVAYQYWRITALLRAIGKGFSIQIDEQGDWNYLPNRELGKLVRSFDDRNQSLNTYSSLLGVWLDNKVLTASSKEKVDDPEVTNSSELGTVFFPVYNLTKRDLAGSEFHGHILADGSVTNFIPYFFNVGRFLQFHNFMESAFTKKHGYNFKIFLSVLEALSTLSILPQKSLNIGDENLLKSIKSNAFLQTLSRGYHVFAGSSEDLCRMLVKRIKILSQKDHSLEEIRKVVADLSLGGSHQSRISPWSGGPRATVIPAANTSIIDFVGIPNVLATLFVFMPDKIGSSGTVFEKLFRDALKRRGFVVTSGNLLSAAGDRELDAGVQIGDCLYVFECVSIERPLDFEIGNPKTINGRINRLTDKLEQVESLKHFIKKNPAGKNYDYSSVKRIEHFVVSPFVEWIWSHDEAMWADGGFPRFVTPDEVFLILGKTN